MAFQDASVPSTAGPYCLWNTIIPTVTATVTLTGPDNQRRVGWAALLTGGFMVVEAVGGVLSGSLALLADAGHMLTDAAALALAWLAFRIARRPSDWKRTYGFHRFQVLAAYSNGLTLFFIALAIAYEAFQRLREPAEVLGGPMLAVAVLGLVVNIAAFLVLHGADRESLNVRGAMLHVLGDLLGSAAAIVAALVILWTGWTPIDPLLSVLVAVLILRSAWFLVGRVRPHPAGGGAQGARRAYAEGRSRRRHSGRGGRASRACLVADGGQADGDAARARGRDRRCCRGGPHLGRD